MITKDKVVKVTDFGIARAVTSSTIVRSGNVIGSVHYFSPEQASGGVVDFKSDIYSMGVVLYEMLTGRVPFDAENPVAIAKMHVDNPVQPPMEINPDIPESVNDIVIKAMKKQPSKRYQKSEDLAADLRKAITDPDSLNIKDGDATQFVPVVKPAEKNTTDDGNDAKVDNNEKVVKRERNNVVVTPDKHEKQDRNIAPKIAWIVTILIFLVSVGSVCALLFPTFFGSGTTVEVPDLRGMTIEEAREACEGKFRLEEKLGDFNSEYDKDQIYHQEPAPGLHKNVDEIEIKISRGMEKIVLEDYTGKEFSEVKRELEKLGIDVIREEVEDSEYDGGKIVRQKPASGSTVKSGDSVTLYESAGGETVTLKDYTDEDAEEIKEELEDKGIEVVIEEIQDSDVEIGKIVKQKPESGEKIKPGKDTVTLYVSAEEKEEKVAVPYLIGLDREDAEETLESVGLKVGTVFTVEVENTSLVGKVTRQVIAADQKVTKNTKISFYVGISSEDEDSGDSGSDEETGEESAISR